MRSFPLGKAFGGISRVGSLFSDRGQTKLETGDVATFPEQIVKRIHAPKNTHDRESLAPAVGAVRRLTFATTSPSRGPRWRFC